MCPDTDVACNMCGKTMICSRCGAPATPVDRFCGVCGSQISVPQPPPPPPPPNVNPPPPPWDVVHPPPPPPRPDPAANAVDPSRVSITDAALAGELADVEIGRAFAFFGESAFRKPGLAWAQRLLGGAARPRVVSLLSRDAAHLPGATIQPPGLGGASLASVTSDKALYREGRDEVHLLALDPFAPHAETALEIKVSGADFAKRPVKLDGRGAAAIGLRDLPPGDYEVRLRGAAKDAPACSFTVAAYKLAPLVAQLASRSLEGQRLTVSLRLESFGAPVDGKVQLELSDRGQRLSTVTAEAKDGAVEATFQITGKGPHAIQVQLVSDPGRTATVPIVGSRAEERSQTVFSTLGAEVLGSLLPSPGSHPVRGIHLEEGATRTSPFRLERVDASRARLTPAAAIDTARIVVLDPRVPTKREGALDPDVAPHPGRDDDRYIRAEELFKAGKKEAALALFEEARAAISGPAHPNYAYWIACVLARLVRTDAALAALDEALRDGWKDFDLLGRDEDLASLRGHPTYEARRTGGATELVFDDLAPGLPIEVDVPAPMAILAIGAFVDGAPWEGWAAVISPPKIAPKIEVPRAAAPGEKATITVDTGCADGGASVYVVVKDARLLSPDTPESRLAGGLKRFVERTSKLLAVGRPSSKLSELAAAVRPFTPARHLVAGPPGSPADARLRASRHPLTARQLRAPPTGGTPDGFGPPPVGFGPPPPRPSCTAARRRADSARRRRLPGSARRRRPSRSRDQPPPRRSARRAPLEGGFAPPAPMAAPAPLAAFAAPARARRPCPCARPRPLPQGARRAAAQPRRARGALRRHGEYE